MKEAIQLIILETESVPKGYRALELMNNLGAEILEFYPHAKGVRLLGRSSESLKEKLPKEAVQIKVSTSILRAMLSQTSNKLKNYFAVAETKSLIDLLKIAIDMEKAEIEVLEIRTLRSNLEKNYAIFTLDNRQVAEKILEDIDYTIIDSKNTALKEVLGFN